MAGPKLNATITIGGAIASSFKTAIGGVDGELKRLGTTVKTLKAAQASLAAGKGLIDTTKLDAARVTVTKVDRVVERLKKRLEKDPGNVGLQAQLARAQERSAGARSELSKLETAHSEAEAAIRKATGSTKLEADTLAKLQAATDAAEKRMKALNQTRSAAAKVGASFRNAASEVGRAATIIGGSAAAIGGAIFAVAKSTSDAGDDIAKTAVALGMTTTALQELRYAGERGGVSIEEMDKILAKFTITVSKGEEVTKEQAAALDELGYSAEDLAEMGPEKSMDLIADALGRVGSEAEKTRIIVALFGKGALRMKNVLGGGSAELAKLKKEAHDTGNVLSSETLAAAEEFNDKFLDFEMGIKGLKNQIGAEFMPVLSEMFGQLKTWLAANGPQVRAWAHEFAVVVKDLLPKAATAAIAFGQALGTVAKVVTTVVDAIGGWGVAIGVVTTLISAKAIVSVLQLGLAIGQLGLGLFNLASTVLPVVMTGIRAMTVAIMANPLGAIITGIALAGAAVIYYWEPIKTFFGDLFGWIGDKFTAAIDFWVGGFQKFGEWISGWWDATIGGIKDAWDTVTGWFSDDEEEGGGAKSTPTVRPGAALAGAALATAAATAPLPAVVGDPAALDLPPAATSSAAAGSSVSQSNSIVVNAAPGQDPKEIAMQVDRILRDRQAQARNGALYD